MSKENEKMRKKIRQEENEDKKLSTLLKMNAMQCNIL
jgi:hypothetical protein